MRIAVAGGTGVVGRHVVEAARATGHETFVLSRSAGVDLLHDSGLVDALSGVDAVIDTSDVTTTSRKASIAFFETATRNLLAAERAAGVGHHVVLSIVGIDRVPFAYYAGKQRQEELTSAGSVPWSIVRATQFHEFAGQVLARQKGPVAFVPTMRSATVSTQEVAQRLVDLAVDAPVGFANELRGPEVHSLPDLARRVVRADQRRRLVLPLRLPGKVGSAMAHGGLLPTGTCDVGTVTFDAWLATP